LDRVVFLKRLAGVLASRIMPTGVESAFAASGRRTFRATVQQWVLDKLDQKVLMVVAERQSRIKFNKRLDKSSALEVAQR
jgi:hypothetical protein